MVAAGSFLAIFYILGHYSVYLTFDGVMSIMHGSKELVIRIERKAKPTMSIL